MNIFGVQDKSIELQDYYFGQTDLTNYKSANEIWSDLLEIKKYNTWPLQWSNGKEITLMDIESIFSYINE